MGADLINRLNWDIPVLLISPLRGIAATRASEPFARSNLSIDSQGPEIRLTPDLLPASPNCRRGESLQIMWVDSWDLRSHSSSFIHHIPCGSLSPGMSENLKLSRSSGISKWCNMLHKVRDRPCRLLKWWVFWCVEICGYTFLPICTSPSAELFLLLSGGIVPATQTYI